MRAIAVTYNGTEYYYVRNAQGDIIKLIDSTGATVVEYTYDSWGKLLSITGSFASTLGSDQPFRYRGYVYDTETSLYYLQTRYYDPATCRFISSDVVLSTGQGVLGHNAYAYCGNNPVARIDSEGEFWNIVAGAVVGAFIGAASNIVSQVIDNAEKGTKGINVWSLVTSAAIGAVEGAVSAAIPGAGAIVGALASAADSVATDLFSYTKDNDGSLAGMSWQEVGSITCHAIASAGIGFVTGSWGSGFTDDVMDEGVHATKTVVAYEVGRAGRPISKATRSMYKRQVEKAGKKLIAELFSGFGQDIALFWPSWGLNKTIDSYWGI